MDVLRSLLSAQEARVVLGYRLGLLLPFRSSCLAASRVHPKLNSVRRGVYHLLIITETRKKGKISRWRFLLLFTDDSLKSAHIYTTYEARK